jgi:hypothetical protein
MSHARAVWADLRTRRLWPVAVALVLALIAIPVALGHSGSGSAPSPAAPSTAPATTAVPVPAPPTNVVKLEAPSATAAVHGRPHDPFRGHGGGTGGASKAKASTKSVVATPVSGSSAPAGGSAPSQEPSSPSSSAPQAPVTPTPASPAHTAPAISPPSPPVPTGVSAGWRTDIDFGAAGSAKHVKDVLRLRELQADGHAPLLVYLGVKHDHRTVLFMLAGDATPTGDGRCLPKPKDCQLLALHKGDAEFFDVPSEGDSVVQYELDLNRVSERRAPTRAAARRVLRRESKAGRKAMYAAIAAGHAYVGHFMYASVPGVLLPHAVKAADTP